MNMRFILLILLLVSQAFSQRMQAITAGALSAPPAACADPTFNPAAGSYYPGQSVTLASTTSGATICYTPHGSTPAATTPGTCSTGSTYSTAISVAVSATVKALATKSAMTNSSVSGAAYVIYPNLLAYPTNITNAAWDKTASSATNATTWVTAGSGAPSLNQYTITVTASTNYTVSVTGAAVGTDAGLTLDIYDSAFSPIVDDFQWLTSGTPHTFTHTFSSGANTTIHFSLNSAALVQTFTITGATLHR